MDDSVSIFCLNRCAENSELDLRASMTYSRNSESFNVILAKNQGGGNGLSVRR